MRYAPLARQALTTLTHPDPPFYPLLQAFATPSWSPRRRRNSAKARSDRLDSQRPTTPPRPHRCTGAGCARFSFFARDCAAVLCPRLPVYYYVHGLLYRLRPIRYIFTAPPPVVPAPVPVVVPISPVVTVHPSFLFAACLPPYAYLIHAAVRLESPHTIYSQASLSLRRVR